MTFKSLKFLLLLGLVNTVLFYIARTMNISVWIVISIEVTGFVVLLMIKTWFDPAQQLAVQGSHMGWVAAGTVRDEDGWRDTLLRRDDILVRVSFKQKALYIVEPRLEGPYRDFVQLERILTLYG